MTGFVQMGENGMKKKDLQRRIERLEYMLDLHEAFDIHCQECVNFKKKKYSEEECYEFTAGCEDGSETYRGT